MNLYCGVTFLCCGPFLTENTIINLHLQSRASQREDQSGHYPGYLGLLDFYFMTREPNLQLRSFYTPLHLSLSIAEMSQQQFKNVVVYKSDRFKGFFLGAHILRKAQAKFQLQIKSLFSSSMCVCVCGRWLEACFE